jgi:hypothetical protein
MQPRKRAWLALVLLLSATGAWAEETLPSIGLPQKEEAKPGAAGEADKEVFPRKLEINEMVQDAGAILPQDPCVYLECANGEESGRIFSSSSFAEFLGDKRISAFFQENPITWQNLFTDLPEPYSRPDKISLFTNGYTLSNSLMSTSGKVALAIYAGEEKADAVFLSQVGRDRKQAFEKLVAWRDAFLGNNPNFLVEEGAHEDDYLDVIRSEERTCELALGIVRDFVVVSTNAELAKRLLSAAADKSGGLAQSPAYLKLGGGTSSQAAAKGFIDLRRLLQYTRLQQLPGAVDMIDFVSDVVGRGRTGQDVIYYDLNVENKSMIEHLVSPAAVDLERNELPGLPARLLQVCQPAPEKWDIGSTRLMPYQPDFFLAAQIKPSTFASLLEVAQPFGSSDFATQLAIMLPETVKRLLTQDLKASTDDILRGEMSLALLPVQDETRPWIFAFDLHSAEKAAEVFAHRTPADETGGVKIFTAAGNDRWEEAECYAVIDQARFQNLPYSYLLVTSSGKLMQNILDQATAISATLKDNKDFADRLAALGGGHSLVWYYNLPAVISHEYQDLAETVNAFFPRIKTITRRPPIPVVSQHMPGVACGVALLQEAEQCRTTLVSPTAVAPTLSGMLALNMPRWVRERARLYLSRSRSNIGKMWLELQTYATQRGHYPESLAEFRELFPKERRASLFACPAAVEKVGYDAALEQSYLYLSGLRTNDEPDLPILYEGAPWHSEYRDMLQPQGPQPTESGPYSQWRLVLHLDGTISAYSEEEFQAEILPRIRARE